MTSHLRSYPSEQDVIIPWNRRYTFPTIANKAEKVTSRIQPKTLGPFSPGNQIQIDLPAQGYLNPANTFLEFDVTMVVGTSPTTRGVRFQNNIQSIFSRCEIKYGSTPLEDIDRANTIVRGLTEWTATAGQTFDQTSVAEGIGNTSSGMLFNASTGVAIADSTTCNQHIRQKYIQGIDGTVVAKGGYGNVNLTRRYCVQPIAGMLQQRKLIPVKYMANQFTLILTLAQPEQCMFGMDTYTVPHSYSVSNVNLICETLNFDPTFDEMFIEGLRSGGIPIKFSSWRSYTFSTESSNSFYIAERAKSVKSLFAVLQRSNPTINVDSGAMPFMPGTFQTLQNYQYQVGTKYYPATPVQCGSGTVSNGAAEAYCELSKALYTVGNYQLSSAVNALRWGHPICLWETSSTASYSKAAEVDFEYDVVDQYSGTNAFRTKSTAGGFNVFGQVGSQCFAQAISLESATSTDYSGLNAEEASTIILRNAYSAKPGSVAAGCTSEIRYDTVVFAHIDKMIVLGENNTLTLLE
jgi:hypothetical protein